ncbi:MAG: acyl carrier protein [Clostridiales bacterium]|nr:acyl carrier protein [Clostridiales bacterium]
MERNECFNKVIAIVAEHLHQDAAALSDNTSFIDDLSADSLEIVELIMAFESEFDLEIPEDEVEAIKTIGDVVDIIVKNK